MIECSERWDNIADSPVQAILEVPTYPLPLLIYIGDHTCRQLGTVTIEKCV